MIYSQNFLALISYLMSAYMEGGIVMYPKGELNPHLDYETHPKLRMKRKVNCLIYINPQWQASWGGGLNCIQW